MCNPCCDIDYVDILFILDPSSFLPPSDQDLIPSPSSVQTCATCVTMCHMCHMCHYHHQTAFAAITILVLPTAITILPTAPTSIYNLPTHLTTSLRYKGYKRVLVANFAEIMLTKHGKKITLQQTSVVLRPASLFNLKSPSP